VAAVVERLYVGQAGMQSEMGVFSEGEKTVLCQRDRSAEVRVICISGGVEWNQCIVGIVAA
jgi:hypothetical protein